MIEWGTTAAQAAEETTSEGSQRLEIIYWSPSSSALILITVPYLFQGYPVFQMHMIVAGGV